VRRSVYNLSAENVRMIEIARGEGAHAKFTGSGGAAVGVYKDDDHFESLRLAYARAGYKTIKARVIEYPKRPS
jgi:glucuronokinase